MKNISAILDAILYFQVYTIHFQLMLILSYIRDFCENIDIYNKASFILMGITNKESSIHVMWILSVFLGFDIEMTLTLTLELYLF